MPSRKINPFNRWLLSLAAMFLLTDSFSAVIASDTPDPSAVTIAGDMQQELGCSADWSRTAYTFSPELSRGVREAFVRLYEKDLIYRGHRVIHWCPRCLTSLSDEEAEFQEETGRLYHVAYPVSATFFR